MADGIKKKAQEFVSYWNGRGYEKGESQVFWNMLLRDILGIERPEIFIEYEDQVMMDKSTGFIDAYIPSSKILIEQKSVDKDLRKAVRQSDGSLLTPYQQAKKYIVDLPYDRHPRWVITCNFKEFNVYDMNKPTGEPEVILLSDLPKEYYRLSFIVDTNNAHLNKEMELSIKAGDIVGLIYNAFAGQYRDLNNKHSVESLNKLCVRIVFCLYAEDADLFRYKNQFHDYLNGYSSREMRQALIDLFKVLDTPEDARENLYLADDVLEFPYVNGGLFSDEEIEIPIITDEIRELLLAKASDDFDWSEISPTIFGAVFESTLNPETRRSGGMHYTSIENIHKVIDPLFLNELEKELDEIKELKQYSAIKRRVLEYQEKLSKLKFMDPAAGSGNFLTESYISLRKLENEALRFAFGNQQSLFDPIKVSISQFYGIEINDFAVSVAQTALWIAESQMMKRTEDLFNLDLEYLPLKSFTNIHEGNALLLDWNDVIPANKLNYIMGNPPFVGARIMSKQQKADLLEVIGEWKNAGNLDYVAGWYRKAADMMTMNNRIRGAFVSTNSITQGEQVSALWMPLILDYSIKIDFAYRTFIWDSEANNKAHVHCVIIGFSPISNQRPKILFTDDRPLEVTNINGYLMDADNIFVVSRSKPICNVPEIGIGNKPIDGGYYLFTKEEMENFIQREPSSQKYFMPWYGSVEFINRSPRYCLWLGDCSPSDLMKMPECMKRVQAVREYRLASTSAGTVKLADKPTRFHVENMPTSTYIVIPEVSSERRRYVPMGFMTPDILCSNLVKLIPNATLYHFGVLTSNVHMAWMRAVCGRLKSDYRYSKDIVYNNFPWPEPTAEQITRIEKTARDILKAREQYSDTSFADLYGEYMYLFPELLKAHQENDKAVMEAYGFDWRSMTESECVVELLKLYQKLT